MSRFWRVVSVQIVRASLMIVAGAATLISAASAAEVRVVFPPIVDALPLFVAKDQGLFEKRGLEVTLTAIANQSIVVGSLVAKSADVGFSVAPTIMQAADAGIDLVIIAGATEFPHPQGYAGILARTDSGIKKASDLAGKRIAVAGLKAFHHLMTVDYLARNGVNPGSVSFVEVAFPQQPDVLKSGQVDAIVTVDPLYARVVHNNIGYAFEDYTAGVPARTLIDFYVATRAWASANAASVKAFRDALSDAGALIKANEKDARASLQRWTKVPEQVAAQALIPNFKVPVSGDQMDFWLALAKRQSLITKPFKGDDFIFN
jgi:NitT/TauT family transport system substrate-binding protein